LDAARVLEQEHLGRERAQQCACLPVAAAGRARLYVAYLPGGPVRNERSEFCVVALATEWTEQDVRLPGGAAPAAAQLARAVQAQRLREQRQRAADVTVSVLPAPARLGRNRTRTRKQQGHRRELGRCGKRFCGGAGVRGHVCKPYSVLGNARLEHGDRIDVPKRSASFGTE